MGAPSTSESESSLRRFAVAGGLPLPAHREEKLVAGTDLILTEKLRGEMQEERTFARFEKGRSVKRYSVDVVIVAHGVAVGIVVLLSVGIPAIIGIDNEAKENVLVLNKLHLRIQRPIFPRLETAHHPLFE